MTNKTFVGRDSELFRIREWLKETTGGLVLITGSGGIGKSCLLNKIEQEYSSSPRFAVEYFDLAEQPIALINQAIHLTDSLGRENFRGFMQKLKELNTVSQEFDSSDPQTMAIETCLQEVKDYLKSSHKTLLRITDTYEIVLKYTTREDDWVSGINEKLKDISGTVFILAGRDRLAERDIFGEYYPKLVDFFGEENILHIPLSGFNGNETNDFFAVYDRYRMIPQEMREKLYLLTDGRPVLLSLAVEWLQKNIPLPVMTEKSLLQLEEMLSKSESVRKNLLDEFEFELTSKVRQLQSPLDIATLYMAHIDRRMDSKLLSVLLDVDDNEAKKYLQELFRISFVKEYVKSDPPRCALHDEMRDLVKKHAWRYLDISGEERKHLARKVIEKYYQPRIASLRQGQSLLLESPPTLLQESHANIRDQERWHLESEVVYYSAKLGEVEGFAVFDRVFYDKEQSYIRDQFLLDELKRAGLNKEKIALREADHLRRYGQSGEAREIFLQVLEKNDLGEAEQSHVYNTLGVMDSQSDPGAAEKNFHKALEFAEKINNIQYQIHCHNNLGKLYKNTSQLEDAIFHFEQALGLAHRSGNPDIGSIRNNLASTYRLNGNLDQADALCSLSIAEHQRQGRERLLAYACLTKADIYRERSASYDAGRYAEQALVLFNRLGEKEGIAQAYCALANISRYSFDFEQALRHLRRGTLAVGNGFPALLADLYQLYGRTYRHYAAHLQGKIASMEDDDFQEISGLYRDALAALEESIRLARQVGNRWVSARSQIEIALIMRLNRKYDESKLNDLLSQVWQTANELNDPLLKGYVCENRAHVDIGYQKYREAGFAFGEAACYLAKRTGSEATRAFARLRDVLLSRNFSKEQSGTLAEGMREQIRRQEYQDDPKLMLLVNLCEQILGLASKE